MKTNQKYIGFKFTREFLEDAKNGTSFYLKKAADLLKTDDIYVFISDQPIDTNAIKLELGEVKNGTNKS